MKLIIAIVGKSDSLMMGEALRNEGIYFTKIATVGGLLDKRNYTFLMCIEDEKVEPALKCIREHCSQRTEIKPMGTFMEGSGPMIGELVHVTTGGATVFVTDVTYFEKM
ncbi:MAG: cyclic-di-AMP receptor [Firmicutes bacterium]|nr:cyclic-di-AMP receptor [Bacillota bacterium]MBQ1523844.1 cyclic-di-AMP receptor [Bacillota bacterium]MBQ2456211.1 cyclic-di-AMP receptor [Bacillota bacterium]MBQ3577899.1 cyclic-di-AMP receptor [Bacillota bacterium]MBQ4181446.1 cyclic-di-AMP receptor [Bacillota bacterium]